MFPAGPAVVQGRWRTAAAPDMAAVRVSVQPVAEHIDWGSPSPLMAMPMACHAPMRAWAHYAATPLN